MRWTWYLSVQITEYIENVLKTLMKGRGQAIYVMSSCAILLNFGCLVNWNVRISEVWIADILLYINDVMQMYSLCNKIMLPMQSVVSPLHSNLLSLPYTNLLGCSRVWRRYYLIITRPWSFASRFSLWLATHISSQLCQINNPILNCAAMK